MRNLFFVLGRQAYREPLLVGVAIACGLLHAAFWALAPMAWAGTAARTVVASAAVLTMAYGYRTFVKCRPATSTNSR